MKKALLITLMAIAIIGTPSCSERPTTPEISNSSVANQPDIPIEIQKLVQANQFDTVLAISTNDKVYVYDYKTKKYLNTLNKPEDNDFASGLILFFVGLLFVLFIIAL